MKEFGAPRGVRILGECTECSVFNFVCIWFSLKFDNSRGAISEQQNYINVLLYLKTFLKGISPFSRATDTIIEKFLLICTFTVIINKIHQRK